MEPMISLVVQSAFAINGAVAKKGQTVEVREALAKDLLARGKAVLGPEQPKAPGDVPPSPVEPQKQEAKPPEEAPKLDELEKLNRASLAQKAQELGLTVDDADTKATLKAKIAEALKAKG